jgi:ATP-dependent DNA helicase RecG
MAIVDGGDEYLKPRNIGLLFFNDEPEKFFPYIQIDVVHFPDDEGGDIIQEAIFKGPLDHQLTTALRHIKNNFVIERVLKIPGQAEAKRFFNYPYEAIEEALVNAVYHRSYEIREPIEVRINRTSISVVSHPGPDPSISTEDIKAGRMISRRYRNRRIGEFLKELDFTEGRGTGVPKMRRALQNNGSNNPVFFTDNERASFWVEINIHPAFLEEHAPETHVGVHDEVHDRVYDLNQTEMKIINIINNQIVNSSQIVAIFGYKTLTRNIKAALRTLLEKNLIVYTIPDKPRSKRQQYKITPLGKTLLNSKSNENT